MVVDIRLLARTVANVTMYVCYMGSIPIVIIATSGFVSLSQSAMLILVANV